MKKIRYITSIALIAAISNNLHAQLGGRSVYSFLNLTPTPQVAALGGAVNAVPDADPALAFYNPALLDSLSDNSLSLNYVHYLAGINFGYAAYAKTCGMHRFAAGVHYVNYGRFTEADELGEITGSFTAADYAFNLTYARPAPLWDSLFTIGVNLKPVLSVLERYSSFGLAGDFGITYHHPKQNFVAALVIRNVGAQLTTYTRDQHERLPFELQLGLSQKLTYAPFRISLVLQHLERRLGNGVKAEDDREKHGLAAVADEALRHIVLGLECQPFKGLVLRGGYNYHRRQEMKVMSHTGTVGFSWGAAIHVSRFHIDYARTRWHLAGASNHFAISVDL